jgi:hypothetical protein
MAAMRTVNSPVQKPRRIDIGPAAIHPRDIFQPRCRVAGHDLDMVRTEGRGEKPLNTLPGQVYCRTDGSRLERDTLVAQVKLQGIPQRKAIGPGVQGIVERDRYV